MDSDSISVSSKIKELYDLNRSGVLSNEEYLIQLKNWITCQMKIRHARQIKTGIDPAALPKKEFRSLARKLKKQDTSLLETELISENDDAPIKAKVEKILWAHLN